jgi:iron complex outermembrane receptor protein
MKKIIIISILLLFAANLWSKPEKKDTMRVSTKEVVVSAMKYPETILEIPMAVSIVEPSVFEFGKGYGLEDALKSVPGVLVQSRFGNQDSRITIRGFGARGAGDRSNAGTSRGIKILIDNIPETEPDGRTSFDNIDLSTASGIEVLRSNASALWGNASGGVINISSMPLFDDSFARFEALGGSYGFQKYLFQSGTKLGASSLVASYTFTKCDGWRANSNSERSIINLGFKSVLSDKSLLGLFITGTYNKFYIPGPLTQAMFDSIPEAANPTYNSRKEMRYNRLLKIGITFDHKFDKNNSLMAMGYANPKYLQRSERNTFRDFTRYHLGGSMTYKNELEFSQAFNNILLAGVDGSYQDGAILFYNLTSDGGRGDQIQQNKSEGAGNYGAYLQDEIIWDRTLSLILGLRYDNVSYYSQDFMALDAKETRQFEHVTPKVGLSWRVLPEMSVYFNMGGGVEVPAGNETDPAPTFGEDSVYLINPLLDPIVSTTFELGTKQFVDFGDFFIKGLNYDVAAYFISVKNEIIPYSGGKFYFSAGKTERLGFELGLSAQLDYGLSLSGAFTYCASKYVEYKVDSVHYNNPGAYADFKDNKMAGLPDYYYSAALRYAPSFLGGVFTELGVQGISSYWADDANKYEVPSYTLLNATIGMLEPLKICSGLGIKAFAAVQNITDEKYASSAFINPDLDKTSKLPVYLEPGLPRNFVFGLSFVWE